MVLPKINLFIAGAPRCGTSSLYNYLKQHPEVFMVNAKEPHLFDTDLHEESDKFHKKKVSFKFRDGKSLNPLFKGYNNEKIVGEATPTYLLSRKAAKNIQGYNPDSKIIICLRDPVDLLYSWHSHLLWSKDENISDFKQALQEENQRKKWANIPDTAVTPSFLFYSELVSFSGQIQRFIDVFGKKSLHVLLLDDMKKDHKKEYKSLCKFLEISTDFTPDFTSINPNFEIKSKFLHNLIFSSKKFPLKNKIPLPVIRKLNQYFKKLTLKPAQRKKMDPILRSELKEGFKSEVSNLDSLLHKNGLIQASESLLNLWGYN